jgi:hypothetical protein
MMRGDLKRVSLAVVAPFAAVLFAYALATFIGWLFDEWMETPGLLFACVGAFIAAVVGAYYVVGDWGKP